MKQKKAPEDTGINSLDFFDSPSEMEGPLFGESFHELVAGPKELENEDLKQQMRQWLEKNRH